MINVEQFQKIKAKNETDKQQSLISTLPLLEKEIDEILSTGQNIISIFGLSNSVHINNNINWYITELNRIYSSGGWTVIEGYKTLDFTIRKEY